MLTEKSSLFWLLEEPIVYGSRIVLNKDEFPGMNDAFIKAGVVTVKDLAMLTDLNLNNVEAVAKILGIHSFQKVRQMLSFRLSFSGLINRRRKIAT